jgi:hypothetical protein
VLQTCTGPSQNVVIVILCLLYVSQGRAIREEEVNCHRFVKRVAEVNFVTSVSVALVFKSHVLIFGGS